MKKVLKVLFWIIALILFPITAGLYYIWPGRIFKDKMSKGWNIFWWITYALIAFANTAIKILFCTVFILMAYGSAEPVVRHGSSIPAPYRTNEDFYKLTGVEFPELEMVDSLFFDEHGLPTNYWNEYKFVTRGGHNKGFYKRLELACETDSRHWEYSEGSLSDYYYNGTGEPIIGDRKIYKYWIYPDEEPVDRSRGMCDRMVVLDDGSVVEEWDGSFISVEVRNDTIVLRKGWLR